ncbi:MAG: glycosyltransferase family 39 protein [Lachnospiraceae bacterium]|nr:glycosyltransferase family 39 protein [Lachnospiraceae bacterium]
MDEDFWYLVLRACQPLCMAIRLCGFEYEERQSMNQKKMDRLKMAGILGAGFLLRFFYVLFSTIYDRQYDIGMIDLDAGHTVSGGHLAYIQYIYENLRLPNIDPTSVYQFHHPPLHHFCCAIWMRFCSIFIHNTDVLEESIQMVPFICSLLILLVILKILRQFDLREKTVCLLMLLFSFHPALVLLSGSVNNDCMSLLFTLLCVYTTIRWSRKPNMRNIIYIALSISLGMLTKQNVAEMAFPIAFVFIYMFVKQWRERGLPEKMIKQFALFGVVSVPIGMSFYVRNLILYKTPLIWVYTLPEDSWQYTGNVPVLNRFLWPVLSEMADNLLHFKIGCGYNVWMQIIRTSVLGEWDMMDVGRSVKVLAVLLMVAGAAMAFLAFIAFCKVFIIGKNTIDIPCRIIFVASYLVNLIFYLKFAYDYPHQCSMSFRYIEIELLFPAVALGIIWQRSDKKWFQNGMIALLAAFCLLSMAMIGVWCLG